MILAAIANAVKLSTYYTVSLGAATSSTLEQPSPTTENSEELDLCNGVHSVTLGDIRKDVDVASSNCSPVFKLKCYGILGEIGDGVAHINLGTHDDAATHASTDQVDTNSITNSCKYKVTDYVN